MRNLALAASVVAVFSAGCVAYPAGTARQTSYEDLRQDAGWVFVDGVPLVRQRTREDCGVAALSMVLAHWGVDAPAETLEAECFVPGEEGVRAVALRDAARRRGFSAFLVAGRVADLDHELRRGRPVVVGLLKSAATETVAHFEVVVGLHSVDQRVAALDPARGLVCDALSDFAGEWAATNGVALVVFLPEKKPATSVAGGP
jgi:ABC-type bacteriocin/lantibiotic exporter with double-glycine peptidase domain